MTVASPPRPPEQDELCALIEEARRRAVRRRRRYGIAVVLAALCGAGLFALLGRGGSGSGSATRGARAAGVDPQTFQPSRFWYTRTVRSMHQWLPAGGITVDRRGYTHRHGPETRFDLRVSEETWVGLDGTIRVRTVVAHVRFASGGARAKWLAYGRPVPNFNSPLGWMSEDGITVGGGRFPPQPEYQGGEWLGPSGWDVGDSLFSYQQLLSLPSGPAALRARLALAETALARRGGYGGGGTVRNGVGATGNAFAQLSDIAGLLTAPLPASLRLALFHAAITMPGALVNQRAHDSLGRPGVAVSASAGAAFERLIFDQASGALLENAPKVAVAAQGVAGSPYALPKGVTPVHAPGAPPQPRAPAISPAVGNRMSVFKLTLSQSHRQGSQRRPALNWLLIGTPGARCFAAFVPQLPPLNASPYTRLAGGLTYIYRLTPASVHRRTWCPGRYELTVVPDHSPRQREPYLGAARNLGSTIYFQVR